MKIDKQYAVKKYCHNKPQNVTITNEQHKKTHKNTDKTHTNKTQTHLQRNTTHQIHHPTYTT